MHHHAKKGPRGGDPGPSQEDLPSSERGEFSSTPQSPTPQGNRGLARYDAARRALAEAHRVDEVKDVRDKAVAMQHFAWQAKDTTLITQATDIRMRAEHRAGELPIAMAERKERAASKDTLARGRKLQPRDAPKLADLEITKTHSSRWQRRPRPVRAQRQARQHRRLHRLVSAPRCLSARFRVRSAALRARDQPDPAERDFLSRSATAAFRSDLRERRSDLRPLPAARGDGEVIMYDPVFLDEIRAKLPILDVVARRHKLRKEGNEYRAIDNHSLCAVPNKGIWKDHGAGAGKAGDIEGADCPFVEAVGVASLLEAASAGNAVPWRAP
jgi:hypothetical protein